MTNVAYVCSFRADFQGGTHEEMREGVEKLTDDQKDLLNWMDERYFKVQAVLLILHTGSACETL